MRALAAASVPVLLATVIACGARPAPPASGPVGEPPPHDLAAGPAQLGDCVITLLGAGVGRVKLIQIGGVQVDSPGEAYWLKIRVENGSLTKRLDYRRWTPSRPQSPFDPTPYLKDEHANRYRPALFGLPGIVGAAGAAKQPGRIMPGSSDEDLLLFDPPVPVAMRLVLRLPGFHVNADGHIDLAVPRSFP